MLSMMPVRKRKQIACYLTTGLAFISVYLYYKGCPLAHYTEGEDCGIDSTTAHETLVQFNSERVPFLAEWEDIPLAPESVHVVPSSPLPVSENAGRNTAEELISAAAATGQQGTTSVKKDVAASIPMAQAADNTPATTTPKAHDILTSSLYDPGFAIPSSHLCQDAGSGMQLLVLVTSAPDHVNARKAIRETWGTHGKRKDVSIGFLVAYSKDSEIIKKLEAESARHSDIIRANFVDSFRNLTLKTISMFEWVSTYCPEVRFILKTDDDVFINVPRLLGFTNEHSGDNRTIYGELAKKWTPIRRIDSKYYVSRQNYKPPVFPDFTLGPAYLLTSDTIHDLYVTALNKTFLHLEDVYATGIVAQDLRIKRVHVDGFLIKRNWFRPCSVLTAISIHGMRYYEQFDLWQRLLDGRTKCK